MSKHVMLDLETLGTRRGDAVLQAGACLFDLYGDTADYHLFDDERLFSMNIDRLSCHDHGLTAELDTVAWWNKQPRERWEAMQVDARPLPEVIDALHDWFIGREARYVWCNGAGFDDPIWRGAALACGRSVPWKFWDVRDTRTIWYAGGVDHRKVPRNGPAHDALADAIHQARCVQLAFRNLRPALHAAVA